LAEALLLDQKIEDQCPYCGEEEGHDSECPILLAQQVLSE
jgi:hypothetical protein